MRESLKKAVFLALLLLTLLLMGYLSSLEEMDKASVDSQAEVTPNEFSVNIAH